ncbi:hypothetical protein [Rubrivirga litoralis]|uniref:PcfJ-like protein n=1 Tax=Rubrivirga litoralis TaxID=3075598 RepID=A0ABU3BPW1_9BACT|nr:hypothetical protein [Rubrivirga sp. F394]MDT0631324.1 hypothetical protein [Rubrivirga sp. F394]
MADSEEDDEGDDLGIFPPPARPHRATCSREFRDWLLDRFGPLRGPEGEAYRRLFSYLVFPSHLDRNTGLPVICGRTLAWAAGKEAAYESGNYPTWRLLKGFRKYVLEGFNWSGYTPKLCRVVRDRGFRDDVLERIEEEVARPVTDTEDRVYFVSGKRFSLTKQRRTREREQRRALAKMAEAGCEEAAQVMEYMNSRTPNVFSKLVRQNRLEAYRVAADLPTEARRAARATLRRIEDQPVPFYSPSTRGNTVRLFDQGSIAGLKKEVRHALMAGCVEFDLKSAQLAIIARLWDVPVVARFLEGGGDIWGALYAHLGIAPKDQAATKPTLKTALYALCFGAGDRRIKGELTMGLETYCEAPHAFLDHEIIQALRAARDAQIEAVAEAGGAWDVYGVWRSTDCKDTPEKNARSVLAQLAQAAELHLVFPVIELARETRDFQVVLWQHDGFSVRFSDETKRERWTERIVAAVQQRADDLRVPTQLEYEVLEVDPLSEQRRERTPARPPLREMALKVRAIADEIVREHRSRLEAGRRGV